MKKTSARPADEIEIIVSTYADMLFRLSLIILGNQNDAEDVVQETMLKYMKKAPVFESEQHRKAWLITVARNKCRDIIRFRAKHPTVDIDELRYHSADNTDSGILEGVSSRKVEVKDGKAVVELACEELLSGEYSLVIDEFIGGAKAEQDLAVKGVWECTVSVK